MVRHSGGSQALQPGGWEHTTLADWKAGRLAALVANGPGGILLQASWKGQWRRWLVTVAPRSSYTSTW